MLGRSCVLVLLALTGSLPFGPDSRASTIVYLGAKDYIVAASDGFAYDDKDRPVSSVDGDPIRKLYRFGEGGILVHYDLLKVDTTRVDKLIGYFLNPATFSEVRQSCPGMTRGEWTEPGAVLRNADRLVSGLESCLPHEGDWTVRLVVLFFDDGLPVSVKLKVEPTGSNRHSAKIEDMLPVPPPSDSHWDFETHNRLEMLGQADAILRAYHGADRLLADSLSSGQISVRAGLDEREASLAGDEENLRKGIASSADPQKRQQLEVQLEKVSSARHFVTAAREFVNLLPEHQRILYTCPNHAGHVIRVEQLLESLFLGLDHMPRTEECAGLITTEFVRAQLRFMRLPGRTTYEKLRWEGISEKPVDLPDGLLTERITVHPGQWAVWEDNPRPSSQACQFGE